MTKTQTKAIETLRASGERIAIGIPSDAEYSTGHVVDGRQRWTWTAKRPFSPERCERCYPEQKAVR